MFAHSRAKAFRLVFLYYITTFRFCIAFFKFSFKKSLLNGAIIFIFGKNSPESPSLYPSRTTNPIQPKKPMTYPVNGFLGKYMIRGKMMSFLNSQGRIVCSFLKNNYTLPQINFFVKRFYKLF